MTSGRTERLMNLLIMLLMQRHFAPKQRIRSILYPDVASDAAFERMFDRDKEELRSLGVPIEVGQLEAMFDDEVGYRIRADELALPEIRLSGDEAAVVALASRLWQHQRLARATTQALRKLTAAGVDVDVSGLDIAQPRLAADDPSFEVVFEAVLRRQAVEFDYWRSGTTGPARRHLQPWGITRYAGRWYVVGFDTDRDDERLFRLSRVRGEVLPVGPEGAYTIPADLDLTAIVHRLAPAGTDGAVLLVRRGAAHGLRVLARVEDQAVVGPDGSTDWDRLVIERGSVGLADEILSYGASAVVESPEALREDVVARLRAALA